MAKKSKKKAMKKPARAKRAAARPRKAARRRVAAVPKGYRTVTPHLVCRGTADAIQFYMRAFGAKERLRMSAPDGSIAHAELQLGDSMVMLGEEAPQQGALSPQAIGGTPVNVFLYVADVDRLFARAVDAGATVLMPPTNMFWGDRYAQLSDPFGHKWSMATHVEDVSPKEMGRRMNEFYAQGGPPA